MKLLITTQAVDLDDPILGFFHRWIEEFAKRWERVEVICLKEGRHALPENVRVHSLGKEKGGGNSVVYAICFKFLAWKLRNRYDAVFVHMNPEYVVIAGPLWRLLGKKVALWYTHKSVTLWLRIASVFAQTIFTASEESMRLPTPKKKVMGHGIDVSGYPSCAPHASGGTLQLISVGRIAPVKNYELMFAALEQLQDAGISAHLELIGGAISTADEAYLRKLKALAQEKNLNVTFSGHITPNEVPARLCAADIFLNTSTTGSLDKAVLEAMVVGIPVVTSNEGLRSTLAQAGRGARAVAPTAEAIATAVQEIAAFSDVDRARIGSELRHLVMTEHSLPNLIERITSAYA